MGHSMDAALYPSLMKNNSNIIFLSASALPHQFHPFLHYASCPDACYMPCPSNIYDQYVVFIN